MTAVSSVEDGKPKNFSSLATCLVSARPQMLAFRHFGLRDRSRDILVMKARVQIKINSIDERELFASRWRLNAKDL